MKTQTMAFVLVLALGLCGCSLFHHHQPKSEFKIIDADDPSPFIKDNPTRAGTITKKVEVYTY